MAATMREITMAEVKEHRKRTDFWTVIDDCVYDLTSFVDEHPGGDILLDVAGIDGTDLFLDIGHSRAATAILKNHQIGVLKR